MSEFEVKGLSELQAMLDEMPAKIEQNIVRGGLRAGAKVMLQDAQERCPVSAPSGGNAKYGGYEGALRDSLRISMRSRRGRVMASIKAGNKIAYYAHMVEFGTASHFIKPAGSGSLFLGGVFVKRIDHPGAARHPFMRPAMDGKAAQSVDAMADYCRERIPKELAKR
jgi:HK97 gp10 family phage protein